MIDLSPLTDDQLVALAEACVREAVARNPAVAAAMRDMMLSEAERVKIARAAADIEIAAQRARQRAAVAEEAAAAARAQYAADVAARVAAREQAALDAQRALITAAASLCGVPAKNLAIVHALTKFGQRVLINSRPDRWARTHIVDYHVSTGAIKTTRALAKRKPDLSAICAQSAIALEIGSAIIGRDVL